MRTVKAIIKRNLTNFVRDKGRIFGAMLMPAIMLFMSSFVMTSDAVTVESPINYLIAGAAIMIVFQGAFNNSTAVLSDIASGLMREIIVAPVARKNIAIGNILSAALVATLQGIIVLVLGFAMGFKTTVSDLMLIVLLMLLSGGVLSSAALFMSLAAKNQTNYQMISSMLFLPAMFLSGAYIPTAILPKVVLPLVYLNPLTYLTGAFRYAALGMSNLGTDELVRQGVAYRFGIFTVMPAISWIFLLIFGILFFILCVQKFKKADLSEIQGRVRGRRI